MEYSVGLDVSLKKTAICVVDGSGKVAAEGVAETEPAAIDGWLKATGFEFPASALRPGNVRRGCTGS